MKTVTHTASFVVDCYDILAERWLDILPADEREIALLAIIARARQGLDDMGRLPEDLPAVLPGANPARIA